jgi:hypothetical protein
MTATNRNTFRPTLTSLDDRVMLSAVPMQMPLDTDPNVPATERPVDETPPASRADSGTEMVFDEPAYTDAVARWEAEAQAVREQWQTARQANWDEYEATMKGLQEEDGRLRQERNTAIIENFAKYAPLQTALWAEYAAAGERSDGEEQARLQDELAALGEQAREELEGILAEIDAQLEANLQAMYEAGAQWRAKEEANGESYYEAMEALAAKLPKAEDFMRPIYGHSDKHTGTGGSSDLGDIGSVLSGIEVGGITSDLLGPLVPEVEEHAIEDLRAGEPQALVTPPTASTKPADLNPVVEFVGGMGDNLKGQWDGIVTLVTDPIGTLQNAVDGISTIAQDPIGTAQMMWDKTVDDFQKNPARASGNLITEMGTSLVPWSKVTKVAKLGKIKKVLNKIKDVSHATGGLKQVERVGEKVLKGVPAPKSGITKAPAPVTQKGNISTSHIVSKGTNVDVELQKPHGGEVSAAKARQQQPVAVNQKSGQASGNSTHHSGHGSTAKRSSTQPQPNAPRAETTAQSGVSKRGVIKNAQLPTSGPIRYVPPSNWKPGNGLPMGTLNGRSGFKDKFGNIWSKGPGRAGDAFEWDVQLSNAGKQQLGHFSKSGSHINVSPEGKITH